MAKYYHNVDGVNIAFTAEEEATQDILVADYNSKSGERKLKQIKEIRLNKLQETDYLSLGDVTMSDNIKTWRQSLRDIPQDNTTEEQYDVILARDEQGNLTHAIWSKP